MKLEDFLQKNLNNFKGKAYKPKTRRVLERLLYPLFLPQKFIEFIQRPEVSVANKILWSLTVQLGGLAVYVYLIYLAYTEIGSLNQTYTVLGAQSAIVRFVLVDLLIGAMVAWLFLGNIFRDKQSEIMNRIQNEYCPDGNKPKFSKEEIKKAAEVFKKYRADKYDKVCEKYGKRTIDLLLLAQALWVIESGTVSKLVSIKSIEEDREAGPKDDY